MSTAYQTAVQLRPGAAAGRFLVELPESWRQGRGAFGGVVAAWLHRAFSAVAAEPGRPLRSMAVQFAGGLDAGDVAVAVEVVRRTGSLTHATARLEQQGQVAAVATCVTAVARQLGEASTARNPVMPQVLPPEGIRPMPATPLAPAFVQHLDTRYVSGRGLFSGAPDAYFAAWVRLNDPSEVDPAQQSLLADVLPPAVFATLDRPRPGATISMTLHFLHPERTLAAGERVLVTSSSEAWGDGYSSQSNDLWAPDGELLIRARQMVVVIK